VAQPAAFKYRAFLSYSHRDKSWGEWLHRALEGYRIDKDLVGRQTAAGQVPNTLRPIFRDRDDFSAGHSLTEQTLAALEASQFLVVVCSPRAAVSKYVDEEILRFKAMGRSGRVVAIIVDGEPGDPARECFPPALRFKVEPDGQVTDVPEEPIAADARRQGDGKRYALQKLVAALIDVPFDDVRKRDAIGDSRRIKIAAAAIGVVTALALFTGYLFIEHSHQQAIEAQRIEAQEKRDAEQARQMADLKALTEKLISMSHGQAAPAQGQAVAEAVNAAAKGAQEGDDRLKRALDLLKANKVTEAEALFRAVAEDKAARIKQDSKDAAAAYRNLGAIAGLADPKRALDAYSQAVTLDPDDLRGLFWVGWLQKERGYLPEAEAPFRRILSVAKINDRAYYLYWARLGLGDIRRARGDLKAAQADYLEARAIAERVAKTDPSNARWQRNLSASYDQIGDVLVAQGNLPEALKSYRDSLAIVERLAKMAPTNAGRQRDLSVSNERIGDIYLAQGNLDHALAQYRASLNRMVPIRDAYPSNTDLQRFTSVTLNKIGDVLVEQGNLAEALKYLRDSLTIRERLAKADPNNAGWQSDLAVSYERIGDVLKLQGNLVEALKYFREDLAIAERLAKADPAHVEWQVGVVSAHWRLAANGDNSARRWAVIVTTLRQLKQDNKLTVEQAHFLRIAEEELAKLNPQ
jgi:tetratricopeptide (TPR) repeat protein